MVKRWGVLCLAAGATLLIAACSPVISSGPTVAHLSSSVSGATATITFGVTWNGPVGTCSYVLDQGPATSTACSALTVSVPVSPDPHVVVVTATSAAGSDTKSVQFDVGLHPGACYRVTHNGFAGGIVNDIVYNGPVVYQNTTVYSSTDGSCTGTTIHPNGASFTVVQANSDAAADSLCASLNAGGFGFRMDGTDPNYFETWSTPANSYICGSFGEVGP
jgi:hypothetical protein